MGPAVSCSAGNAKAARFPVDLLELVPITHVPDHAQYVTVSHGSAHGRSLAFSPYFHGRRDFVARVSRQLRSGHLAVLLRETDVLWTSEFQHLVECVHGNRDPRSLADDRCGIAARSR